MKNNSLKFFWVIAALALIVVLVAVVVLPGGGPPVSKAITGGGATQVVTPVLSSPGKTECLAEAKGFAYDNPTNVTVYWIITNWPAGCTKLGLSFIPNPPATNGYVLQAHLNWVEIPPIGPPIDCATCSIPASAINGAFHWTNSWPYVPTKVVPELLVMSYTNRINLHSINFAYTFITK